MSLIVSYLVVSKVYLSLDRYMAARTWTGHALMGLRELNQLALTFTEGQSGMETRLWRREVSVELMFRCFRFTVAFVLIFIHPYP